jgi:chromate transporter
MKELYNLFLIFFKIGLFTFGGGYAMLPVMQKEFVDKLKFITEEELLDYYAIGQCTPGVIAVNTSTFIGYKRAGIIGSIFSTAGMILPSIIIIIFIALFITNFLDIKTIQHAFAGIRVAVSVLIISAVVNLWKSGIKDLFGFSIFLLIFFMSLMFNIQTIYLIIIAVILGISKLKFSK